jgi:uncharacterized membrane protein
VKLLFLLLVLLAAAWFAPAPLSHVENSVDVATPRDRVWALLADVSGARLWDPLMKEVHLVSSAKSGVGAEREAAGALVKTHEKVTEWVPFNAVTYEVSHEPKLTRFETSRIDLSPAQGGATRVRWRIDYQMAGGYLGVLADKVLLGSVHQGRIDEALSNLKRYAETGEVPVGY